MSYFSRNFYYPRRSRWHFLGWLLLGVLLGMAVITLAGGTSPPPSRSPGREESRTAPSPAPLVSLPAGQSPVIAIAKRVGPSVVGITNYSRRDVFAGGEVKSGSGIVIDAGQGYIVTNYHVIEGFRRLLVTVDGEREYEARLVGGDPDTDLAVVQVKAAGLTEAALGDSAALQVGELVVAVGNPLGPEFARTVTAGVVSALDRQITVESRPGQEVTLRVLQTDAAINPGNSGGALANSRGEVVGINSVKIAAPEVEGMGFAIPINDARPVIEQLISRGRVLRPFLGISFQEVTPQVSRWSGLPTGLYISDVLPGSPADRAGLRNGDVLVEAGGQRIVRVGDLQEFLNRHQPGDQVELTVVRGEDRLVLRLILGEKP